MAPWPGVPNLVAGSALPPELTGSAPQALVAPATKRLLASHPICRHAGYTPALAMPTVEERLARVESSIADIHGLLVQALGAGPAPDQQAKPEPTKDATPSKSPITTQADHRVYPHTPRARNPVLEDRFERPDAINLSDFRGLYNLSLIMLGFSLVYNVARNVRTHGLQLTLADTWCPEILQRDTSTVAATLGAVALVPVLLFIAMKQVAAGRLRFVHMWSLHGTLMSAAILGTCVVLYISPMAPMTGVVTLGIVIVLCMKLHSFVATNAALRVAWIAQGARRPKELRSATPPRKQSSLRFRKGRKRTKSMGDSDADAPDMPLLSAGKEARELARGASTLAADAVQSAFSDKLSSELVHKQLAEAAAAVRDASTRTAWPATVRAGHFFYFLLAPTLVYEVWYPRTPRVRITYVLKRLVQMAVALVLQWLLMSQFVIPTTKSASGSGLLAVAWSILRIALPQFFIWLAAFYSLFHCWLSALAELLRFADRRFYSDWYNASSLDEFWRKWNEPVHEFCLRHVFIDSMRHAGLSKTIATLGVFIFSAVFHEVIASVAFKTLRPWFFFGMLAQAPLVLLARTLAGKRRGNALMWLSLFLGQPLIISAYLREWFETHDALFCMPDA